MQIRYICVYEASWIHSCSGGHAARARGRPGGERPGNPSTLPGPENAASLRSHLSGAERDRLHLRRPVRPGAPARRRGSRRGGDRRRQRQAGADARHRRPRAPRRTALQLRRRPARRAHSRHRPQDLSRRQQRILRAALVRLRAGGSARASSSASERRSPPSRPARTRGFPFPPARRPPWPVRS